MFCVIAKLELRYSSEGVNPRGTLASLRSQVLASTVTEFHAVLTLLRGGHNDPLRIS